MEKPSNKDVHIAILKDQLEHQKKLSEQLLRDNDKERLSLINYYKKSWWYRLFNTYFDYETSEIKNELNNRD